MGRFKPFRGPTGRFPRGKVHPSDEGELQFLIAVDPNTRTIIIDFGKPVKWVGLDKAAAVGLIERLQEYVKELPSD